MDKRNSLPDLDVTIATDDEHPPSPEDAVFIDTYHRRYFTADEAERIGRALIAAANDWRQHAATATTKD